MHHMLVYIIYTKNINYITQVQQIPMKQQIGFKYTDLLLKLFIISQKSFIQLR